MAGRSVNVATQRRGGIGKLATRGKIFISYRRDDVPGDARGVCNRLERTFGKANVFMDVDRLLAGQRFDRELDKALSQCDVLIAVIGPRWMESLSEHARGGERDFVHDEIAAALKRDIVVIPALIGREGRMPSLPQRNDLPEEIRDLVLYQKHDIAHESFNRDADHLTAAITSVLRGGRRVVSWRAFAISGAIGLTLIAALLGYRMDMIPWIGPSTVQPRPITDTAMVVAQSNSDASRADEAARKKTAEEASRQAAEAAKRQADKNEEEAARKKAAEEYASRQAAEVKRQADADAANKKAEEEAAGKKAAADCDRLAASPADTTRPSDVAGVYFSGIDVAAATVACGDAMRRYPEVVRFVFQAGRAADAQKDFTRALELYRKASAAGSAAGMTGVGELYRDGQGVPQDYSEARKWFEKAAMLGNSDAMTTLGVNYERGRSVAQNYAEARKWYEKAALLGNSGAMNALGNNFNRGLGVAQNYAEARKWYEKAAALNNATAMYNLGVVYEEGQGVAKSLEQARNWYQKAADGGHEDAKEKLKKLK
jgi:TPR repeat protein